MNYKEMTCVCGHKGFELKEEAVTNSYGVTAMELYLECPVCGCREINWDITNENAKRFSTATRKKLGRVSYEETLKLPKKYGVSRELLNVILELDAIPAPDTDGLVMVKSIWDDRIPTEEESERIRKALEKPKYFLDRLEKAENRLPADRYEKIHARVSRMK